MTALVGHSQNASVNRALPLIQAKRPPFWVAIDPPSDAAAQIANWGVKLVVRSYSQKYDFNPNGIELSKEPRAAAMEFVGSCALHNWWPHAWAVMTPPAMASPQNTSPERLQWAIRFQQACVELLREEDKQCFVCNVPTGNDGYYVEGATYYGCQEYGWPRVMTQAPWHALRYRSWFGEVRRQNPNAKLAVLECGSTYLLAEPKQPHTPDAPHGHDIGFRGGYGIPGVPVGEYVEGMRHYASEATQDGYVLFLAAYQVGGNEDWATFEVLDTPAENLISMRSNEPNTPETPELHMPTRTEIDNALNIVWGTKAVLKGEQGLPGVTLPNLGQQLEDAFHVLKEAANPR